MDAMVFASLVLARLPVIPDADDWRLVIEGIRGQAEAGWTVEDSAAFHRVMQEVDPSYPEEAALKIMAALTEKYKDRGRKIGCGCCVGPVGNRCVCTFHCDIPRGEPPTVCSLHQPPGVVS